MIYKRNISLYVLFFLLAVSAILEGCSKNSNPAVPGAPEGDVITTVERNPVIRVGLLSFSPQKHLFVSITRGTYYCYVGESLQPFATGMAGEVMKFTGGEDSIKKGSDVSRDDEDANALNNRVVRVEPAEGVENGHILIGPESKSLRAYRGKIRLILEGKNLLAVNEVHLEDYLLGVLPAEMDPTWNKEALKAQAVASRTYALFNIGRYGNRGFDIADDARSQEYGGIDVETDATTRVVVETTDEVIAFEGNLACVVFHYESNGQTASNLDVWPHSGVVPYLRGISDKLGVINFGAGKFSEWKSRVSFEDLRNALNRGGETFVGSYLSSVSLLGLSENGYVQSVDILGEKNPIVSALDLIRVLNRNIRPDFLPSNKFTIKIVEDGVYEFSGSGKGHGVGMCQWGAKQRAEADQGYKFILTQYFPGTEVIPIPLDGIKVVHNTSIDQIH